jgi:hypothetical protein
MQSGTKDMGKREVSLHSSKQSKNKIKLRDVKILARFRTSLPVSISLLLDY